MARYAREACILLRIAEHAIQRDEPTFGLGRVVHGIVLFSEIDVCNFIRAESGNTIRVWIGRKLA